VRRSPARPRPKTSPDRGAVENPFAYRGYESYIRKAAKNWGLGGAVEKPNKLHQKRERSKKQGLGTRRFSACLYLLFTAAGLFQHTQRPYFPLFSIAHVVKQPGPVGLLKNSLFAFLALFPSTANEQK
jgi:hypothetical protein